VIRGIKKNGATPLDGYDFGYGGTGYRRSVFVLDLSGGEACAGGVLGWVASVRPGAPAGALWEHRVVDGNEWGRKAGKCRPGTSTGRLGRKSTRRGAGAQPYRFSTKCHDEETGLLYYGHYAHHWGRWLSKDPIGERGGVNLYGVVGNNPALFVDILGRVGFSPPALPHPDNASTHLGIYFQYPACVNDGWTRHCVNSCILQNLLHMDGLTQ
jgi:RHS repeat-associated protein